MKVLVTGGAGYIGSHTVLCLLEQGHEVIVVDNLVNASFESIRRVEQLTGKQVICYEVDICNELALREVFAKHAIDAVIHFAGLKAVGESVAKPVDYYQNNVFGSLCLLRQMLAAGVHSLVFSSSATVYGLEAETPYRETTPRGTTLNPYGASKAMVERIFEDVVVANPGLKVCLLRYFNPIGAHESGLIGEDPQGIPNNLMPFMAQVAVGRRDKLSVFGGDYETADGTCRRDYLHVMDLAEGHVKAIEFIQHETGCHAINLGTGTPVSVLEMIAAFEEATGVAIPYEIVARRAGDLPQFWADPNRANQQLGWYASRSLETMMADTWRWQSQNPQGYN